MDAKQTLKQRALVRASNVDRNSNAALAKAFELISRPSQPIETDFTGVQQLDQEQLHQQLQEAQ